MASKTAPALSAVLSKTTPQQLWELLNKEFLHKPAHLSFGRPKLTEHELEVVVSYDWDATGNLPSREPHGLRAVLARYDRKGWKVSCLPFGGLGVKLSPQEEAYLNRLVNTVLALPVAVSGDARESRNADVKNLLI